MRTGDNLEIAHSRPGAARRSATQRNATQRHVRKAGRDAGRTPERTRPTAGSLRARLVPTRGLRKAGGRAGGRPTRLLLGCWRAERRRSVSPAVGAASWTGAGPAAKKTAAPPRTALFRFGCFWRRRRRPHLAPISPLAARPSRRCASRGPKAGEPNLVCTRFRVAQLSFAR